MGKVVAPNIDGCSCPRCCAPLKKTLVLTVKLSLNHIFRIVVAIEYFPSFVYQNTRMKRTRDNVHVLKSRLIFLNAFEVTKKGAQMCEDSSSCVQCYLESICTSDH